MYCEVAHSQIITVKPLGAVDMLNVRVQPFNEEQDLWLDIKEQSSVDIGAPLILFNFT